MIRYEPNKILEVAFPTELSKITMLQLLWIIAKGANKIIITTNEDDWEMPEHIRAEVNKCFCLLGSIFEIHPDKLELSIAEIIGKRLN